MKFLNLFMPYQHQLYLNIEQNIDSRIAPKQLIKSLENKKVLNKFIKLINTSPYHNLKPISKQISNHNKNHKNQQINSLKVSNSSTKSQQSNSTQNNQKSSLINQLNIQNDSKILRRIQLCHLLLLYSSTFYDNFIYQINIPLSSDEWLNQQIIQPYLIFLKKCSMTHIMYEKCKKNYIERNDYFEMLFYVINLLKLILKPIQKIRLLGKFYKHKSEIIFQNFVEMIAVQAKQLYFTFKNTLILILSQKQALITKENQQIIKVILLDDLAEINQNMKLLLLGKEFYPYGRGIGIKLFRIDQATQQLQNTMRGIVTDHLQTNRRIQKQEIESNLFNRKTGEFNVKYFEETLTSSLQSGMMFKAKFVKANVEEEVILSSSSDEQQIDHAEPIISTKQSSTQQVDTNESNLNKEGNI